MSNVYSIGDKGYTEDGEFLVVVGHHPTIEGLAIAEGNGANVRYLRESRIISLR
jgi:hypothetical protein